MDEMKWFMNVKKRVHIMFRKKNLRKGNDLIKIKKLYGRPNRRI